ncbi:MAG: phosphate ABC transporter permease PstA [Pirellulales bacterium]|nr:phosphate ABC transporter permease PstA [Pirellulales bacterium]
MCSSPVSLDLLPEHGGGTGPAASEKAVRPAVDRRARGKRFWRQGEPMVWATGAALAAVLFFTIVLLGVVVVNAAAVFWPEAVGLVTFEDGSRVLGVRLDSAVNPDTGVRTVRFKTGNRELDPARLDFHWYEADQIREIAYPEDVFVLERLENGNFYGFLEAVRAPNLDLPETGDSGEGFRWALAAARAKQAARIVPLTDQLSSLSDRLQSVRHAVLRAEYEKKRVLAGAPAGATARLDARLADLAEQEHELKAQSDALVVEQQGQEAELGQNAAVFRTGSGATVEIPLVEIVRHYRPNAMGFGQKVAHYFSKVGELLTENPRESNTEGGLFPAIFGTVMLVFLMAVSCFPLGVLAGIYLGEYAKEGPLVRTVRIAVNNLAGIPSIVYGIFGLGFFVYGIGGLIDLWFFPERTANNMPTFGTGGILWASLTLGLLTVPVVIVSTEEALRTIPRGLREGSYALGATRFQTLVRVLLPMASPGMMTGFILAMARAAGEVAPLMITGVVKLAPDLPVDGAFPYFHPDRKFMHLGFHIYDIGFQSPNVEASKPMVYVTTMLLLVIVLSMSSLAIWLRSRMRRQFHSRTI